MIQIRATTNVSKARAVFAKLGEIARAPFDKARGTLARRRITAVLTDQLSRGGHFGPGGFIPHTPTQPFGTKPATVPPLGGASSSIAGAIRGGPGGAWTIAKNRVKLSLSLIYASVHHEGAQIGVTPKMRSFVRHNFGVNIRPSKRTINIPRRPLWDARSPQLQKAARGVIFEAVAEAVG